MAIRIIHRALYNTSGILEHHYLGSPLENVELQVCGRVPDVQMGQEPMTQFRQASKGGKSRMVFTVPLQMNCTLLGP